MQILNLPINKIIRDPNQPRHTFKKEKIDELAATIKTVGVINPIEVSKEPDGLYKIITGESRFRACKQLGMPTVPCKILEISDSDRLLRQVIENIQFANLTPLETAHALERLLASLPAKLVRDNKHTNPRYQKGYKELAEMIGKDINFVRTYLDLLEQPKELQTAIEQGLPVTHLTSLAYVPKEHKQTFKQKLLAGQFKTRDGSRHVAEAIKRNPDKAKQLLAIDYSKYKTTLAVTDAVAKISPRESILEQHIIDSMKAPEELAEIYKKLKTWCQNYPLETIGSFHISEILITFQTILEEIKNWRGGSKKLKE